MAPGSHNDKKRQKPIFLALVNFFIAINVAILKFLLRSLLLYDKIEITSTCVVEANIDLIGITWEKPALARLRQER